MNYINIPNLPQKKVGKVIMQTDIGFDTASFEAVSVPVCTALPLPEQKHADMQIIHMGNNIFVCALSSYSYYKKLLPDAVIYCGVIPQEKYPFNIAYNACIIGNKMFCNSMYTDSEVLRLAKAFDINIIDIKQGYTKCSTAVVTDNAVITSDKGLYKAYAANGLDVLLISPGNILLKGYDYGFIGGCCGKTDKDILWFYGDISAHPDYSRIKEFCLKHSCKIEYCKDFPLTDIGSVLPIAY